MAGQLGRRFVLPHNSAANISSWLTRVTRRTARNLRNGASLIQTSWRSVARKNACAVARTEKCLIDPGGASRNLAWTFPSSGSRRPFCRAVLPSGGLAGLGRASPGSVSAGAVTLCCRWISGGQREAWRRRNKSVMLYGVALVVLVTGLSYAAVPLYAVFCQATGLGGQATKGHNVDLVEKMTPVRGRPISIRFNADTAASMRWNFRPQQMEIKVVPGETALAFYSAVNPTDKPITGISTYNVVPFEAGQYFNKIQCFCFEEQRLNPREQVDMPVFFYIDPEFADDPKMAKVDSITLSYTFFEAKEGLVLPDPFTRPSGAKALSAA